MDSQPLARARDSSGSDSSGSRAGRYWLVMHCSDGSTREFAIARKRFVIGRLSRSDVHISLPMIGPRHCELMDNGHGLQLTDLGTELGTYVNGASIKSAQLKPGDRIGIGPAEFTVQDRVAEPPPPPKATNQQPAGSAEIVVMQQRPVTET